MIRGAAIAWVLVLGVGCGGDDDASGGFGDSCSGAGDCASGVCWDAAEHPGECLGQACSAPCLTDAECDDLAADAGDPKGGYLCGDDGFCDLAGAKLGGLVCAG